MKEIVEACLQEALIRIGESEKVEVTPATSEKFGHYQCNNAMKLAKKRGKSPRDVASEIVQAVNDPEKRFASLEIAGPGFINITLNSAYLSQRVTKLVQDPALNLGSEHTKGRVLVEYSSPNIAKEMHVGHLRSTIIGDSIARLFEVLGYQVLRVNHVGDWGTQFGMLIAYMQEEVPSVLKGDVATDLPSLMQWYKASKKRFDEDEAFKVRARQSVVALQRGEPEVMKAWKMICMISRQGYKEVYDLLDVSLEERGESFYNPYLAPIVEELEKKGLVTLSEGAKCVFHEGIELPLMVQKSDGGYNYDTTDMAAIKYRVAEDKADRIIVVTDSGQSLHFKLIYETAVNAQYLDPKKVRFDHVPFGVVLGADGKKFKTRSGDTEKLIDLLKEGIKEAKRILKERGQEDDHLAEILGIDAIKYADLVCNRVHDYVFSYERMLRFEGNTATFILYSYVRVKGIKRKASHVDLKRNVELKHPSEIDLGLHLLRFNDVLLQFADELLPNLLCEYLYVLANKFNAFFRDCQVIGTPEEQSRLVLCEGVERVMEKGLYVLGLKTVDKM